MDTEKTYLSKEKYKELEAELDNLKNVVRREVAEQLEYAKSLGDLSENAEYHEARDKQADIEDRIREIESTLKQAVLISGKTGDTVSVGATVVVEKGKDQQTYMIVGSEEADFLAGKISHHSPLGSALLGKKAGDNISVQTPKGETKYKVIEIK